MSVQETKTKEEVKEFLSIESNYILSVGKSNKKYYLYYTLQDQTIKTRINEAAYTILSYHLGEIKKPSRRKKK